MSEQEKARPASDKDSKAKYNTTQTKKGDMVSILREEYNSLKKDAQKAAENWDRLLRAQAEFDNIRKRLDKEKQEFIRFANEGLVADLLLVLDDLERTISLAQQNKEDFEAFLRGIELILGHLYEILKKRGLSPIATEDEQFDPRLHEALLHVETDEVPEHTIVEELQKGYLLNNRVIRTAKVKISKKKSNVTEDTQIDETNEKHKEKHKE